MALIRLRLAAEQRKHIVKVQLALLRLLVSQDTLQDLLHLVAISVTSVKMLLVANVQLVK
jgi:hypothetical protein